MVATVIGPFPFFGGFCLPYDSFIFDDTHHILQRAIDAENRKIEAERMQRELEERRVYEAEQARLRDLSDKHRKAEEAARKAAEEKGRLNEARHNKAAWDGNEAVGANHSYCCFDLFSPPNQTKKTPPPQKSQSLTGLVADSRLRAVDISGLCRIVRFF